MRQTVQTLALARSTARPSRLSTPEERAQMKAELDRLHAEGLLVGIRPENFDQAPPPGYPGAVHPEE